MTSTCIPGASVECTCADGSRGAQVCTRDGTYGACSCAGFDGGTPIGDGGTACPNGLASCVGRCVDTTTDEANCGGCGSDPSHVCAQGAFCIDGVCGAPGCPAPFVKCGADCVDPRTDPAHCGASETCEGTSAGADCGGGACSGGRCVADSCSAALAAGSSMGDGLYLVDPDGSGPLRAHDAYCDMTVEGGGWTLVYKVRNDIPDISDPWWGMVALGAGDAFPTAPTPLPTGTHFEGPTRDVRQTFSARETTQGVWDLRATLLSSSGIVLLDVLMGRNAGLPVSHLIRGLPGAPSAGQGGELSRILASSAGLPPRDTQGYECYQTNCAGGTCLEMDLLCGTSWALAVPLFGDGSIAEHVGGDETTTLFWIRTVR